MTTALDYFAAPGQMTDPRRRAEVLDRLPADIAGLRDVVQG